MSRRSTYFPQSHVDIIRKVLTKAKNGTKVVYVVGNHDEFIRDYLFHFESVDLGNIRLTNEIIHITADGRKLFVTHGDQYDTVTHHHRWIAKTGDIAYNLLLRLNHIIHIIRRRLGLPYWSISQAAKTKVKTALEYIFSFENTVAYEAQRRGCDGAVCGHIHTASIKTIDTIEYHNCGDWVESCTALLEHYDGSIQIFEYFKRF